MKKSSSTTPYHSLSPISDVEKHKDYCDALEWAISNRKKKDIKNIALTGIYGSGKSSILKTFQETSENKDLQFLKISLATFKEEKDNNDKEDGDSKVINNDDGLETIDNGNKSLSKIDQLRLIELSILQQIFYHEEHDKIPESRFKKIRKVKEEDMHFVATLILGLLITFYFAFHFTTLKSNLKLDKIDTISETVIVFFTSIAFLTVFFFILKKALQLSRKWTISKLNFHNLEMEINSESTKSILNNHLDEILYFFEVTDYNVVIIEDLDRFEQTEIFTKLREINLLLNNSKAINRDIVFIYAVRDEMFKDSDRTKFFDFIIPIIPVINYSNSKEQLAYSLKQFKYEINTDLIKEVAFFVDDMRLLYNIVNEFHIYFQKFKAKKYIDKLFAIIVYKNIYPDDFVLLGKNEGALYDSLTTKKEKWIKEKIIEIDSKLSKLNEKINKIENTYPETIKDLRKIYIFEYLKAIKDYRYFTINDMKISVELLLEDENFLSLREDSVKYSQTGYPQNLPYKFIDIEKKIDDKETYLDKEELIENRKKNNLSELRQTIKDLEFEKRSIRSAKIKQLLKDQLLPTINEQTRQQKIIFLLLRNGYIAEDYLAYISYFYPGSLTEADHWFLMNVNNETENEYDYKLFKISNLIKEIPANSFNYNSVLNYNLVDFLLEKNAFVQKREMLFIQLANESETSINFINGFIENGKNLDKFIYQLSVKWEKMWKYIEGEITTDEEKRNKYLKLIIEYARIEDIIKMGTHSNLRKYIAQKSDFLKLITEEEKLIEVISGLRIEFEQLEIDGISETLKDFVYTNNHYAINPKMLELMLDLNGKLNKKQFDTANFTAIYKSECKELIENIEYKIALYVTSVYLKFESNKEEEEYLLKLLNNDSINLELKKRIIDQSETLIVDINAIINKSELLDYVLDAIKIETTWENVINYYLEREKELNGVLLKFLHNKEQCEILSKLKVSTEKEENKGFIRKFCLTEKIENEMFNEYLDSFPVYFNGLDFEDLSKEKVIYLINKKKISFNKNHYDLLRDHFEGLHIKFIENNKTKFFDLFDEITLNSQDLRLLLVSEKLNFEDKKIIIERTDESLFISNSQILGLIGKLTLQNQLFINNKNILSNIILYSTLNVEDRISLFNKNKLLFEREFISSFLNELGGKYSELIKRGPMPSFDKTDYNLELFKYLKSIKYISKCIEKPKTVKITTFK